MLSDKDANTISTMRMSHAAFVMQSLFMMVPAYIFKAMMQIYPYGGEECNNLAVQMPSNGYVMMQMSPCGYVMIQMSLCRYAMMQMPLCGHAMM